jgi:hypothetical protein
MDCYHATKQTYLFKQLDEVQMAGEAQRMLQHL